MRSRILLGTLFGAVGGFVGYFLQERLLAHDPILAMTRPDLAHLGFYVGSMIGLAIGSVEGAAVGSPRLLARGAFLGFLIGGLGGIFGIFAGGAVYNTLLFGQDPLTLGHGGILSFTQAVIARAFAWTFVGAFAGLAAGAATLSVKRAMHGLIGGLIGGFAGGFVFDLVADIIAQPLQGLSSAAGNGPSVIETGGLSRAIGITLIGALTGLFIGLVEQYLKQAWVRVLAGRNEGKDYIISKSITILGRDERADVPLFGDTSLAPQHAAIKMESGRHTLLDGGAPIGSVVNGQRIQQQLLRDGDMIQLGQVRLLFREKATATKVGRPAVDVQKPAQAPGLQMPSHLCPFCGAAKDAQGNCLCSVPGAGAAPPAPGYGAFPDPMGQPPGYMNPVPGAGPGANPGYAAPTVYGAPTAGYSGMSNGRGTQLAALDGPYAGQAFPIAGPNITIGRSPDNGVPMSQDVTVSRRHAHIAEENGHHVLYDDGSSNGTFVNNVRISVQPLAPGDIIQFGASKYRYE